MTRFWTSDQHFGHANILKYADRPFDDVTHMREELVAKWNRVVTPRDEVWVLGDFALGNLDKSLKVVKRLNGTKILVPGNHDKCWNGHKHWEKHEHLYLKAGFDRIVQGPTETHIMGRSVQVGHFPYVGDSRFENPDRFREFRPVDDGRWLLCGHVHTAWRIRGRQINVGVDAFGGFPVPDALFADMIGY